jgi:hypothetical protein
MTLFRVDDIARQFVDAVNKIENSAVSDKNKRADLAGTARAHSFLFELALNGVQIVGSEKKEASK